MDGAKMRTVLLDPWEYEWAKHVGIQRDSINKNKNDAAYYQDKDRLGDNLTASIAAAAGEMAVAKHLGRYWSGDYWPLDRHQEMRDRPDIEPDIEVRRITERKHSLVIRERDYERRRTMYLVYSEPDDLSRVDILGWAEAAWAWKEGSSPFWDRTGTIRTLSQDRLHSVVEENPHEAPLF